jgi:hypothetical protein
MLAAMPLPLLAIAAVLIALLMLAGFRRRNTACLVGAGCVLAVTVGFAVSASLLA